MSCSALKEHSAKLSFYSRAIKREQRKDGVKKAFIFLIAFVQFFHQCGGGGRTITMTVMMMMMLIMARYNRIRP